MIFKLGGGILLGFVTHVVAVAGEFGLSPPLDVARGVSSQFDVPVDGETTLDEEPGNTLAPSSPRNDEYGEQPILVRDMVRRSNWNPWRVGMDSGIYRTSNVALSERAGRYDTFFQTSVNVNYVPKITKRLFADLSVRQSFYRYDRFSELNFDHLTTEAGLLYVAQDLADIHFHAHLRYDRITDDGLGGSLFTNQSLVLGAYRIFPKRTTEQAQRPFEFYVGTKASFSLGASPSEAQRNEFLLDSGFLVRWSADLRTQARYRLGFYDYSQRPRRDFNHVFTLSTEYDLTDWLILNTSVSCTFNDSNVNAFDYEVLTPGVSLGLVGRF